MSSIQATTDHAVARFVSRTLVSKHVVDDRIIVQ